MDENQRDMIELNRLHDEWLNIKKKKLSDQINSLHSKMNSIVDEYANGIVEMYKLAFDEELVVQNAEYFGDTKEMIFSLYAKDGIYEEKADAFAEAFNKKFGTNLVAEIYSKNEFAFSAKTEG